MKHVENAWRRYAERVLPTDASPVQVQETRRAFYGGAASLLAVMVRNVSAGDDITPADETLMESIDAEINQFFADVAGGRK